MFGLRNEVISAQCVAEVREDLKDLTVSVSPLKRTGGSAEIPADHIEWNFVKSIFVTANTRKLHKSDLLRPAPAWFPDCLGNGAPVR